MKSGSDIHEQAARWLVIRDRMQDCDDTRRQFEAWLAADARHRTAYLALEQAWRSADGLKAWRAHDGMVDAGVLRSRAPRHAQPMRQFAAAAVLLLAIATSAWLGWLALSTATYATDVGGFRRVLLEDGSVLQLNTDTRVRVRFAADHREVRLLHGEAHFAVAHDTRRPFDVLASGTVVRAVGTAFTVRIRKPDDVEVVVTEGRVTLASERPGRDAGNAQSVSTPIAAMHVVHARRDGVIVEQVAPPVIKRLLAWQAGDLVFDDVTLGEAVAEFNRYNNRQLSIADAALGSLRIGGNFRATDVDGFVRALKVSFPIEAQESADVITLSRRIRE